MRWRFLPAPQHSPEVLARLAAECGVSATVARLLAMRGLAEPQAAQKFLQPRIEHLHSPYEMLGMQAAVERLAAAVTNSERILIYGDYDVDGTTAVVVLKTAIELCGGTVDFHVPHRIRDGYGMREEVIERAATEGVRLIISVDTGIRAFAAAEAAERAGLDLIVTDHHLPEAGEGVPRAVAVLNPNQAGCGYPCKELCGAGVAFKLAHALLARMRGEAECARLLPSFLKMVAIATIADAVPLVGENRVIARLGLEGLRRPVNGGLKVLMEAAGVDRSRRLTSADVAFRLAPRLNAAGRMDVACDVIELFTTRDADRARELATKLNQLNSDRQQEEQRIVAAAMEQCDTDAARAAHCLVISGEGWHRGVIGIVATRVVERMGRPALVIAIDGDTAHGSGRSIAAFHLLDALESCRGLFTRFGGHAHAVGFALPSERVPELARALDDYARQRLTAADFVPSLDVDIEILGEAISPALLEELQALEPFGMGNREPVFAARGVRVIGQPRVLKEKHLKARLMLDADKGRTVEAVAWRMVERCGAIPVQAGELVDVAFRLGENTHPDFAGLRLELCDLAPATNGEPAAKAAGV